jgi:hypothetical protein
MKNCLNCLAEFAEKFGQCPNCQKTDIIRLSTNDDEYEQMLSEYENESCVHEIGKKKFALLDDKRLIYFFKSEQETIDFYRGFAPMKKTQREILLADISEISLPRLGYAKNQGRVYSFTIYFYDGRQKVLFHCPTAKNNKSYDAAFLHFFSILLVRCNINFRRTGYAMNIVRNKWIYTLCTGLAAFGFGFSMFRGDDTIFMLFPLFIIIAVITFSLTHNKENKLIYTSDESRAESDTTILERERIRKKDIKQMYIAIILVAVVFLGLGIYLS